VEPDRVSSGQTEVVRVIRRVKWVAHLEIVETAGARGLTLAVGSPSFGGVKLGGGAPKQIHECAIPHHAEYVVPRLTDPIVVAIEAEVDPVHDCEGTVCDLDS
jgi:hypothetical protein